MNVHQSEDEQIEALKRWWKENGKFTVLIIIIALVASFGWRFWQQHEQQQAVQASMLYEQVLNAKADADGKVITEATTSLQQQFASSPYAQMASLLAAEQDVVDSQYAQALDQLNWVIHKAGDSAVAALARIRAARLLIYQQQYQAALSMLDNVTDKAFAAAKFAAQGDALAAMGNKHGAKSAYEQALAAMPATEAMYPIVQMKLGSVITIRE